MRRKFFNRLIMRSMIALDDVALPVCLAIEAGLTPLVGLGRDHRDDAALPQGKPDAAAAVGLVADHLGGSQARPPPADAPDRAAADQGADLPGVVNLATGHRE